MSKKTKRVCFRIDATLAKQLREAANEEGIKLANFTRTLAVWAFEHYRTASSFCILRRADVKLPKLTLPKGNRS
jgi:hypothetical protein